MTDSRHRVFITTDRPARRRALVAGAVVALLLGAFGLYRYTRATTVSDFQQAQSERDRLIGERRKINRELREVRAENDTLRDQIAYLNRSQEIDSGACQSVKQSLTELQAESSDLREQLAFYRGIVSPKESLAGVRVYEFKVVKLKSPAASYRYELVLIQPVRTEKRVGGTGNLLIEGLKANRRETLTLADVAVDGTPNLVFSFQYFEEFGGQLRFPEGFRPLRVTVALQPGNDSAPKIEDEYEWAKILQESD